MRRAYIGLAAFAVIAGGMSAPLPALAQTSGGLAKPLSNSTSKYEYKRYTRSLGLQLNAATQGTPKPTRKVVLARQKTILAKAGCDLLGAKRHKKISDKLFHDDFSFVMNEFNRRFDPFYKTNAENSSLLSHAMSQIKGCQVYRG